MHNNLKLLLGYSLWRSLIELWLHDDLVVATLSWIWGCNFSLRLWFRFLLRIGLRPWLRSFGERSVPLEYFHLSLTWLEPTSRSKISCAVRPLLWIDDVEWALFHFWYEARCILEITCNCPWKCRDIFLNRRHLLDSFGRNVPELFMPSLIIWVDLPCRVGAWLRLFFDG